MKELREQTQRTRVTQKSLPINAADYYLKLGYGASIGLK